ncbi:MAG: Hsp20/alpha crystallin family protein [Myxococcota bacterium]
MSTPRRTDPFSELYGDFADRLQGDRWQPDVDVFETEDAVVVRVEIAGVRSEDVRVSVDGPALRISGVRRAPDDEGVQRLHQMEIASGAFERRVRIPTAFDPNRVSARLADGFLLVTLMRRASGQRRVRVET